MSKLTENDFKRWSELFWKTVLNAFISPKFETEPEKKEKARKMVASVHIWVKAGCPLASLFFCEFIKVWYEEGFIDTLPTYLADIRNRIKEHSLARGYYNPSHPLSLAEINQKWETGGPSGDNIRNWWKDKNQKESLSFQMSKEDMDFFWNINGTIDELEINGWEGFDNFNEEDYSMIGFLLEDLIKVVEKASTEAKKKKILLLLNPRGVITISSELSTT